MVALTDCAKGDGERAHTLEQSLGEQVTHSLAQPQEERALLG